MSSLMKEHILQALSKIIDQKMVSDIAIDKGHVVFTLEVDPKKGGNLEPLRQKAEEAVRALEGVEKVTAVLTAEKVPPTFGKSLGSHKISSKPIAPHVRHIIAVASGKGGVGKSTVAANLAAAFHLMGKKAGLLDADIYGSSQPRMMGLRNSRHKNFGEKPQVNDKEMIVPFVAHGVKVMSMGFFVDEAAPVIWRGPMVHSAIQQLLRDVDWGELDILVIDLPPGTGDAQLSLAQYVPLSGAVIVSTPQDVALSEAVKGARMFEKTHVPVLGIIENMSYHTCVACGHREEIFDHGKARETAARLGIEFLGEVPLLQQIRAQADAGKPVVLEEQAHPVSEIFKNIAARLWVKMPEKKVRVSAGGS